MMPAFRTFQTIARDFGVYGCDVVQYDSAALPSGVSLIGSYCMSNAAS